MNPGIPGTLWLAVRTEPPCPDMSPPICAWFM
jgi:hypothetical protein